MLVLGHRAWVAQSLQQCHLLLVPVGWGAVGVGCKAGDHGAVDGRTAGFHLGGCVLYGEQTNIIVHIVMMSFFASFLLYGASTISLWAIRVDECCDMCRQGVGVLFNMVPFFFFEHVVQ